jgi:uncharacterized protein (DUF885 family)
MKPISGDRMMPKRLFNPLVLFLVCCALLGGCSSPSPTSEPLVESTQVDPLDEVPDGKAEVPEVEPTPTQDQALDVGDDAAPSNAEPEAPPSAIDELASQFEGLSLAEFFEVSTRALTLRSPETVVALGLTDIYGVEEVLLNDVSDAYQRETYQVLALILETLKSYDRDALSPEDQISYDVYQWDLEDQLAGLEFIYHDYPATYYPITAIHEDNLQFFSDIHPVSDLNDAQDYVTRLGLVGDKIDQLIENLELRAQAGITPPQYSIQWAVYGSLGQFVDTPARSTRLYTAFKEKLDPLSSITPDDQQALLDEAEKIIAESVLPAYKDLLVYLNRMETYAGGDSGVWRLPQGEAYYAYRLRHFTTTDIPAEDIHQLGLDELVRIHAEMRAAFEQLGYSQDLTIAEAYDRVAQDGGHIAGNDVLKTYESLITAANQNVVAAFDIRPNTDVIVVPDPNGDYYIHPSFDGSRPGAFYAGVGSSGKEAYAMPTLAYHETIPGHHFQIALAQEMVDLPSFRQGVGFTAFAEGWALYAERLAWELGWYDEDPYGYLGFFQSQAFRAARLVVDTGLHAKGWTFDRAQEFFTQNTGFEVGDNVNPQYEIARYLVWPGQSVSYYVGYLKIMELRQRAIDQLGDQFDLKAFHRVVLTNGSLPLEILEKVVEAYIAETLGS